MVEIDTKEEDQDLDHMIEVEEEMMIEITEMIEEIIEKEVIALEGEAIAGERIPDGADLDL